MSPPYLPICGISMPFWANLYVPSVLFKINFLFVCSYRSWNGRGCPIFFHARCVILKMSVYSLVIAREYGSNRDAQSRNEKEIYFMLSNNKFLGKCWYGRQPWIQPAMECESLVEKGINFIFCLGTAYDISSMESIVNYLVVFVDRKGMPPKILFSLNLKPWALAPLQIPTSLCEGPIYLLLCNFYFYFESPSSLIKHQLESTIVILVHWM